MKYIKLFMLTVATVLMASCSSNDEAVNSNNTTVGFTNGTVVVKENSGIINVPISIVGKRNGDIRLSVEVEETGANPAKEDVNYLITSKNLILPSDTTDTATLGVEIKTVDDAEINENRTFKLKITNLEGGQLATSECVITLRDNDAAFYEKFFGKWTMTCKNYKGLDQSYDVTISGPTDEEDSIYDKKLKVSIAKIISGLTADTYFDYSFDKATLKGTLAFDLENTTSPIASYASYNCKWVWVNFDPAGSFKDDPIASEWTIDESASIPTTLTFDANGGTLGFYEFFSQDDNYSGLWGYFSDIVLTRK